MHFGAYDRCRGLELLTLYTDRKQVRRLLGRDVTANLVAAFVLSRLDYGNALLVGLPYTTIAPLQRVINDTVRLVYGLRARDHVTAAAIELHWLPIEARIQYKICFFYWSIFHLTAELHHTSQVC